MVPPRRHESRKPVAHALLRTRIGPFAVDGSTTRPPCVTSANPSATSRRAAMRAFSISGRQSSKSARTTSDGQIVAVVVRAISIARIASSMRRSSGEIRPERHASLHHFTSSQQRSHFLRHAIARPQRAQVLSVGTFTPRRSREATRGMRTAHAAPILFGL
jgi:hypothetical protein